jgi:hypothetical protein
MMTQENGPAGISIDRRTLRYFRKKRTPTSSFQS